MRAVVRAAAYDDLRHIGEWIAKDDPAAATRVIDRIFADIERLAHFPLIGRPGRVAETYEWVVVGLPYIVVYLLDEHRDTLLVMGVFHVAQSR